MSKRIVLIHGFNVRDGGARTVDRIAPYLHGYDCDTDSADYGWHDLIRVRFFHGEAVERIADALLHADAAITHSNGANYFNQAISLINKPMQVFHLSPALDKDAEFPACITKAHVFHTRHDKAVWWAKWLRWHPWGEMGRTGYTGTDERVRNYDYSYRVKDHSGWFKGFNPKFIAARIDLILRHGE